MIWFECFPLLLIKKPRQKVYVAETPLIRSMKIGLISDTHGFLDPKVFSYFEHCDEIWHAGDIGTLELLDELNDFKPTHAVWGNIDGHKIREATPEDLLLRRSGKVFLMTHIAGKPPSYNKRVRDLLDQHQPDVLICGHSHILKVEMDKKRNVLFMNPGAAGRHGFHKVKTLLRFDVADNTLKNLEVVELGPRARVKS